MPTISAPAGRPLLAGLAPVIAPDTRILVLGSFPGAASLAAAQYYAHPRNQLWELVGAILGTDLRALRYEARLTALLEHGVGLWDVIAEAERPGSLDAAIRNATHNALTELVATLPRLRAIGFNGATAARLGRKRLGNVTGRIGLLDLPSSSPAHTIGFEPKLQVWRQLSEYL
jgi:hypoxanthine-DNA glycosylase